MGFVLSKLWGGTRDETLEKLNTSIKCIEDSKRNRTETHKRLVWHLTTYFGLLYVIAVIFGIIYAKYYYKNPDKKADILFKFKVVSPFLIAPLFFLILKRSISWFYNYRISWQESKLKKLKEQRTKIIEDVLEYETFKKAREILVKYAPESLSKFGMVSGASTIKGRNPGISHAKHSVSKSSDVSLRRRVPASTKVTSSTISSLSSSISGDRSFNAANRVTPRSGPPSTSYSFSGAGSVPYQPRFRQQSAGPPQRFYARPPMRPPPPGARNPLGPPLPRPVLPTQKSIFGRVVDYFVGEGPGNRYALICTQCKSHNGMALQEEYEFTSYRCCYCHYWNPAKKQRPIAPELVLPTPNPPVTAMASSDEKSFVEGEEIKTENKTKTEAVNNGETSQTSDELGEVTKKVIVEDSDNVSVSAISEKLSEANTNVNKDSDNPSDENTSAHEDSKDIIVENLLEASASDIKSERGTEIIGNWELLDRPSNEINLLSDIEINEDDKPELKDSEAKMEVDVELHKEKIESELLDSSELDERVKEEKSELIKKE